MSKLHTHPLCREAQTAFHSRFGHKPGVLVHAPGRINLIGEHTDYNFGFVLPGTIEQGVAFAMAVHNGPDHEWYAIDTNEEFKSPFLDARICGKGWAGYFAGAYQTLLENPVSTPAVRCVFTSDLPAGAGLSSSSALTCGFLLGMNALFDMRKTREELAWLAHLVERNFIGLQGGIMDQHACLLCKPGHLLFLDCLDRSFQHIAFSFDQGIRLFLINTHVQHKLTESDYNTRANECRTALEILQHVIGINSLRDLSQTDLAIHAHLLGPLLTKRIQFVLNENERVQSAVKAIYGRDWLELGHLLLESHQGLRDEYQVSCPELDFLTEIVADSRIVLGARMMGGGFGGCTINLSSQLPDNHFLEQIIDRYVQRFGWACEFIPVRPAGGAEIQILLA